MQSTCTLYLDSLSVYFYGLEHKVDSNCVAMALYIDAMLKPLHRTSLANPCVADEDNLERKWDGVQCYY